MLKEFVRTEFELGCGGPTTVGRLQDIARNRTCDTHHGWLPVIKVFLKWPVSASLMRRSLTFQCVVDWTSIERMVLHDTIRRFTPRDEQPRRPKLQNHSNRLCPHQRKIHGADDRPDCTRQSSPSGPGEDTLLLGRPKRDSQLIEPLVRGRDHKHVSKRRSNPIPDQGTAQLRSLRDLVGETSP